jgi:hypothetical protein
MDTLAKNAGVQLSGWRCAELPTGRRWILQARNGNRSSEGRGDEERASQNDWRDIFPRLSRLAGIVGGSRSRINGPYFEQKAAVQTRVAFGDLYGFVETLSENEPVAANRFFGFTKGPSVTTLGRPTVLPSYVSRCPRFILPSLINRLYQM